jgi:hypothetical protein
LLTSRGTAALNLIRNFFMIHDHNLSTHPRSLPTLAIEKNVGLRNAEA